MKLYKKALTVFLIATVLMSMTVKLFSANAAENYDVIKNSPLYTNEKIEFRGEVKAAYNTDLHSSIFYVGMNQFEINTETDQIIQFGPRPLNLDERNAEMDIKAKQIDIKDFENNAKKLLNNISGSQINYDELNAKHSNKENKVYFFRWEKNDSKLTNGMNSFVQVGLTSEGKLISYTNTLGLSDFDINEKSASYAWYVYSNNGGYYTANITGSYSSGVKWNEGYCGRYVTWCSPTYMRYVRSVIHSSTYAGTWDNINKNEKGSQYIFIPRVGATTICPVYRIFFNGGGSTGFHINQLAYSDAWYYTRTDHIAKTTLFNSTICASWDIGSVTGYDEILFVY